MPTPENRKGAIYHHGWLFNVSGVQAVEICLRSGRKYRMGTDEPERLADAIRANLR